MITTHEPSRPTPLGRTRLLLIGGSLRAGSTNAALLHTARAVAPDSLDVVVYERLGRLPYFNPDDDTEPLDHEVGALRAAIAAADALMFCTPEYAGALPGSFKNLLDWTVGGGEIYGKPVAWINVATSPTRAVDAHDSLRKVLRYAGTEVVEEACAHIPVPRDLVGADGLIGDVTVRREIAGRLTVLASART